MNYSDQTLGFFDKVYAVVRLIPKGRVTTYGAIARYIGSGGSSRMVGWAMNASHRHPDIPAQRVVNRVGLLTGKMHFEFTDNFTTIYPLKLRYPKPMARFSKYHREPYLCI